MTQVTKSDSPAKAKNKTTAAQKTTAAKTTAAQKATAPKASSKQATGAKPVNFYVSLLQSALAGNHGPLIQRFYGSAMAYHAKKQTAFPRPANAGFELLKPAEAKQWLEKHRTTSIPAGSGVGRRLFDEMMVELAALTSAKKPA